MNGSGLATRQFCLNLVQIRVRTAYSRREFFYYETSHTRGSEPLRVEECDRDFHAKASQTTSK